MTKKLSFMDSILTKESEELKPHTYRAKILRGNDIVLKEDYNGKPVEKFECSSYGQAIALAEKLNMQAPLPEPFEEGEKVCRVCSVTGEGMNEGWVVGDGEEYFKYEVDALEWCKKNGYKTVKKAYEEEVVYWTEWEEDYQYIMKDGKWVDMEEEQEDLKPEIKTVIKQHGAPNLTISNFPEELDITFKQDGKDIRIEKKNITTICALLLNSINN
jgi:hypothetical protein